MTVAGLTRSRRSRAPARRRRRGIRDGVLEFWAAGFDSIGRVWTDGRRRLSARAAKPPSRDGADGTVHAPISRVRVLARGILTEYLTRVYFEGERGTRAMRAPARTGRSTGTLIAAGQRTIRVSSRHRRAGGPRDRVLRRVKRAPPDSIRVVHDARRVAFSPSRVQALLDVEVALAEALAEAGVIPPTSVAPIRAAARAELYDCTCWPKRPRRRATPSSPSFGT